MGKSKDSSHMEKYKNRLEIKDVSWECTLDTRGGEPWVCAVTARSASLSLQPRQRRRPFPQHDLGAFLPKEVTWGQWIVYYPSGEDAHIPKCMTETVRAHTAINYKCVSREQTLFSSNKFREIHFPYTENSLVHTYTYQQQQMPEASLSDVHLQELFHGP